MTQVDKTPRQLAASYRTAFKAHHELAAAYANGECDAAALRSSANGLKHLRAAYQVARECEQLGR